MENLFIMEDEITRDLTLDFIVKGLIVRHAETQ